MHRQRMPMRSMTMTSTTMGSITDTKSKNRKRSITDTGMGTTMLKSMSTVLQELCALFTGRLFGHTTLW
tara:strand:+ start:306 stop:512 length:207 start_codon:yes stop_codon:yes gene_type:complete